MKKKGIGEKSMSWTSQEAMIQKWAEEESTEEFAKKYLPNEQRVSYYKKFETGREIEEYDFETIPELQSLLSRELGTEAGVQKIIPLLCIAAFQEKKWDKKVDETTGEKREEEFKLPEFVYNF